MIFHNTGEGGTGYSTMTIVDTNYAYKIGYISDIGVHPDSERENGLHVRLNRPSTFTDIVLNREQMAALRDYLDEMLGAEAAPPWPHTTIIEY